MRRTLALALAAALATIGAAAQSPPGPAPVIDALELQVRLERAGFSPGEIDGRSGANTERALAAFATARGVPAADIPGAVAALGREQDVSATATYRIAESDVAGPYAPDIPNDLLEQASLEALAYRDPLEALAERLHASPALLRRLNPGARFAAGDEIVAPNISLAPHEPMQAATVRVGRRSSSLLAEGPGGRVLFHAPVTTGSQYDPLPIGNWKVVAILWHPEFHYNPELFWDADPAHSKATIAAGPNNPVGVVWIDLDKPHYGIHGTPEPSRVGKTESHGCVRLTNWDAARLATMVRPGTAVVFEP